MNTSQSVRLVAKLNRDTKENKIKWRVSPSGALSLAGTETVLDNAYICKVLDKYIRLFRLKAKFYYDEGAYEWVENYRLEFVDVTGKSEWTFPDSTAIYDLYETVRYKTSNVEDFFNKFIGDEKEGDEDSL